MPKKKNIAIDDEPIVKGMPGYGGVDDDDAGEGDDEDIDDDDVGDGDDDGDDDDAEKSDLTESDLVKALDEMDTIAAASANGVNPRERALAAKLAAGSPLTKSERAEMASFGADDMVKSHKEQFMETPQIAQGFEVSDFLDAAFTKVTEALDGNRAEMNKSFSEVGEFNRALAKSLNALGALVIKQDKQIRKLEKSLAEGGAARVAEAAPAKGTVRTAVGQRVNDGGTIRKSGAGQGQGVQLTKGMILDTLDDQIVKSEGQRGVVDGVDLVLEASRYETTQLLSPEAMRLVCKARGIDPSSLGLSG